MPDFTELPLQYLDDIAYWATHGLKSKETIETKVEDKKQDVAKSLIKPTKKALKILEKNAEGVLGFVDDAAVYGSKLLKKQDPLKQHNSQVRPDKIQPPMKMAEYAPGIPSKTVKDLPRISSPEPMRLAIQKHIARKAGLHYDVRIVDEKSGKAYSWAVRSLPSFPGDKVLAKLQPTHTAAYSTWSGVIPEGYGAGTVDLFSQDKIEVIKAEPSKITFNVYKSNGDTERFAMINTSGDDWLFYNVTPTRTTRPEIPAEKPHYKSIDPDTLDPSKPNEVWAPKVDGALNVFLLKPDKPIETYSYRPSAKGVNKLIDHTFRMGLHRTTVPTAFKGSTVVLGETFARDRASGEVLSTADTSARLLSNVWRSRELQERAPLDNIIFNVLRYNGRDVSKKPYGEKLNILKQISMAVPQLKMPPLAYTEEDKKELMKEVKSGAHPLTEEGVVVYKLDKDTPEKAKLQQDFDVYIRGMYPGEGKHRGKAAGGFMYSYEPNGKIVGRVGGGFSDEMRRQMWINPKGFSGQLARVFAQEKLPSGALRMPIFKDIRSEKFASVNLTDYQQDLKKRLNNQHGMIVDWGLGSGKTIGAIAAAEQFGNAKAVVPASLRENFKKELKAYKPKSQFSVESYEHFIKKPEDVKGKTVIFDEAHRLRTSGTARSQAAQALTTQARKVLLLTGTPIQNKPSDIAPLVNIAAGRPILPTDEKLFNRIYTRRIQDNPGIVRRTLFRAKPVDETRAVNLKDFSKKVSPYISYHANTNDPTMPTIHQFNVNVEMSKDQAKAYQKLQKKLPLSVRRRMEGNVPTAEKDAPKVNAFLNATRQISNTERRFFGKGTDYSPKIKAIAENVAKSPGQSLIYSNYLESGTKPLSELLTQKGISNGVFTGKLGDRERKALVGKYNQKRIKALIVSSSGGEGLDLKSTRQVHITEPHWNEAKIEQVIGRSARKGSHKALPEDERNVDVFRYTSLLPERRSGFLWLSKKRPVSADQYLENMSKKKTELNNEFLNAIQKKAYAPSAGPWYGAGNASTEPPSGYSTTLLEEGRTTGEDGPKDPNVQRFMNYEKDGTRPASISAHQTDLMKRRRAEFLRKKADASQVNKLTIGIPTLAPNSAFPSAGIGGVGGGAEIYLSETRHLQGEHETPRLYSMIDFSNAENPASIATSAMTPMVDRLKMVHNRIHAQKSKRT